MRLLHECRATHVLLILCDAKFDCSIHLLFGPRKGQSQVKFRGKIKIENFFLQNYANLVQVFLRIQKFPLFSRTAKNCVEKRRRDHLSLFFFFRCTVKNKDIGLKYCMPIVCIYHYSIYSYFHIT